MDRAVVERDQIVETEQRLDPVGLQNDRLILQSPLWSGGDQASERPSIGIRADTHSVH